MPFLSAVPCTLTKRKHHETRVLLAAADGGVLSLPYPYDLRAAEFPCLLAPEVGGSSIAAESGRSRALGQVEGVVRDPSGAVVPLAKAELVDPASGFKAAATTDPSGRFVFRDVPLGTLPTHRDRPGFCRRRVRDRCGRRQHHSQPHAAHRLDARFGRGQISVDGIGLGHLGGTRIERSGDRAPIRQNSLPALPVSPSGRTARSGPFPCSTGWAMNAPASSSRA